MRNSVSKEQSKYHLKNDSQSWPLASTCVSSRGGGRERERELNDLHESLSKDAKVGSGSIPWTWVLAHWAHIKEPGRLMAVLSLWLPFDPSVPRFLGLPQHCGKPARPGVVSLCSSVLPCLSFTVGVDFQIHPS